MGDHAPARSAPPATAVQRVVDAAQRNAADRIQLALVDLRIAAAQTLRVAAWDAAGVTLLLVGWVLLLGASALLLSRHIAPWATLAFVGLSQCVLGVTVLFLRPDTDASPPGRP